MRRPWTAETWGMSMQLGRRTSAMSSPFLPLAQRVRTGKACEPRRDRTSLSKLMVYRLHNQVLGRLIKRLREWRRRDRL